MQKKLIALAVAGIMAAPMAAQAANAEVYGKVRLSAGVISNDDTNANNEDSKMNLGSHNSRLGIKGSEDLGNGLKAVYQFETEVNFVSGGNGNGTGTTGGVFTEARDTFVGLKGDFGTVKLGRMNSPYKQATGNIDLWRDTHGDYNGLFTGNDNRFDNTIAYFSPSMSGFGFEAAYVTDQKDDSLPDTTDSTGIGGTTRQQSVISLAGKYNNGPLYVSLAYQNQAESGAPDGSKYADRVGTKLSVGYKLAETDLGLVYESDDMGGATSNSQNRVYLSVNQPLATGTALKVGYGMADDRGNNNDTGAKFLALGVTKSMGSSTELYALYSKMDNDKNASFNLYEKNIVGVAAAGQSASVLAVGINLKFSSM